LRVKSEKRDGGAKFVTRRGQIWAKHPDILWAAAFPGIYTLLGDRQLVPDFIKTLLASDERKSTVSVVSDNQDNGTVSDDHCDMDAVDNQSADNASLNETNADDQSAEYASNTDSQSSRTKIPSLQFQNFIHTNGYSVNALFHNLNPNRVTGSHEDAIDGFSRSNYKSYVRVNNRISLEELTAVRPVRTEAEMAENGWLFKYSGISKTEGRAYRGMMNNKYFFEHFGKKGPAEAKKVLANHIFVCIDPGLINMGGITYVDADLELDNEGKAKLTGKFVADKFKTSGYYEATTEADTKEYNRTLRAFREDMYELGKYSARTADSDKIKEYAKTYMQSSQSIREENRSQERLNAKSKIQSKKQKYFSRLVNQILAQVDAIRDLNPKKNRTPIILFGNGKFQSKGHRSSPTEWLKKYLARFFLVIMIDEPYTSQKCSKCIGQLEKMKMQGTRHWYCSNSDCCSVNKKDENGAKHEKFIVHKDISAPMNFFTIFVSHLLTGKRPKGFCFPSDK
jgi:hypothetical protein